MADCSGTAAGANWLDLIQTLGIIVGFGFTIWQLRDASALRRFDIFWRIGDSHRETWRPIAENPSLHRVLSDSPNLTETPPSLQERRAVTGITIHVENVYTATAAGYYKLSDGERRDIGTLFNRSLVAAVWNEARDYYSPAFVSFVDRLRAENQIAGHPGTARTT